MIYLFKNDVFFNINFLHNKNFSIGLIKELKKKRKKSVNINSNILRTELKKLKFPSHGYSIIYSTRNPVTTEELQVSMLEFSFYVMDHDTSMVSYKVTSSS